MTDEEIQTNVSGNVDDNTQDYIAAIKELKQNSVNREDYDRLKAENKKLIDNLVNGQVVNEEPSIVVPSDADIKRMRAELFNPDSDYSNLEFVTRMVDLRDALILKGEPDPFVPSSHKYSPTDEDIRVANKCATVYKECIEYADGDSEVFTNELMRRTKDVIIPGVNKRR